MGKGEERPGDLTRGVLEHPERRVGKGSRLGRGGAAADDALGPSTRSRVFKS